MPNKPLLAFDVGGTTIKYALLTPELTLEQTGSVPTNKNKDGQILKTLLELSQKFNHEYELAGIGISTAGIVASDGSIQYAGPTILDYQGTPIKARLEETTGLSVFVVNDVDAALLGEAVLGAAKNAKSAYCVALGTGIGGAYLANGQLTSGAHGTANSLGYTLFCPKTQTNFEQRASTLSLEAKLAPFNISVKEGFELATAGQEPYLSLLKAWAKEVAQGLSNILLLFDPEVLVIGGAVCQQKDYLLQLLNEQLALLLPPGLCQTKLKVATLADKAQLYGAVYPFIK